jgi:hypothetical protein
VEISVNLYVYGASNPLFWLDLLGLAILDAQQMLVQHYNQSLHEKGLWNKFFGKQDIQYMHKDDVFLYRGQIISASYMGNMAVGYTAYRTYGYFGAIWISVLGEFGWPDWWNFWEGIEESFEANAYGIAEAMIAEHKEPQSPCK